MGADCLLWLVEGLPGAGKSTTAERLWLAATKGGQNARWWLEEDRAHPATPASTRRAAREPDFAARCLDGFRSLLRCEQGILILEGSALQSTVRMMYAEAWPEPAIEAYLREWSGVVAAARPRLAWLNVRDPADHYGRRIFPERGDSWVSKLLAYVERTPRAQANGWTGHQGFVAFWAGYQDLCLDLISTLPLPTLRVEAATGEAEMAPQLAGFFGLAA